MNKEIKKILGKASKLVADLETIKTKKDKDVDINNRVIERLDDKNKVLLLDGLNAEELAQALTLGLGKHLEGQV